MNTHPHKPLAIAIDTYRCIDAWMISDIADETLSLTNGTRIERVHTLTIHGALLTLRQITPDVPTMRMIETTDGATAIVAVESVAIIHRPARGTTVGAIHMRSGSVYAATGRQIDELYQSWSACSQQGFCVGI